MWKTCKRGQARRTEPASEYSRDKAAGYTCHRPQLVAHCDVRTADRLERLHLQVMLILTDKNTLSHIRHSHTQNLYDICVNFFHNTMLSPYLQY